MLENLEQNRKIPDIVQFLRRKDYRFIKELGQGACGRAVLLHDEVIDEKFVCKKYAPFHDEYKEELFKNFIHEIKLLHLINHPNIVRVFNYYIYIESLTGYILMELIEGHELNTYLSKNPENINEIFLQIVEGFSYLEKNNILHRDIRPQNIMVDSNGILKIIDFGFGKQIQHQVDFNESVSLNWWCETPAEFKDKIYDFKTEVYFIGKLFEQIIQENNIEHFKYKAVLHNMCMHNPDKRAVSFASIKQKMLENLFFTIDFSKEELRAYRSFSNSLSSVVAKIVSDAKYYDEIDKIQHKLEEIYKRIMLEENVPKNFEIVNCFVRGEFYFNRSEFKADVLKAFIELLRASSKEKRNIILSNIQARLDASERYEEEPFDDGIPF